MSTQVVQKIKQDAHEKYEEWKQRSVERARDNFTQLPGYLLEQTFGIAPPKEQPKDKSFTSFDEKTREKMGESYKEQDQPELEEVRKKLSDSKTSPMAGMQRVNKEVAEAQAYFKQKEQERKKMAEDEAAQKQYEAQQQEANQAANAEPTVKQARGGPPMKRKAQPTAENRASYGKQ